MMHTYKELFDKFNQDIESLKFGKTPEKLYDPIYYTLKVGGKRIRPLLCILGSELFGGEYEDVINAAFGIEIFHNFTLLHDDMMDNADTRRGKPVVHVKWNNNIALLSGDAMSVLSYKYIAKTRNNLKQVLDVFSETALQICEGQQYDMDFETEANVSEHDYLKMINLKTAVLLAASLKIGALSADAGPEDCENLYEFGKNIGIAFQLQDDMLDVFGDIKVFGKNLGGDIVANKKTYLLIKAMEQAQGQTKTELEYWLGLKTFDAQEKIAAVTSIYEQLNIRKYSVDLMQHYFTEADKYMKSVNVPENRKKNIIDFTESLKTRVF
jgi:geranylgeranyl diphosphate synthase type II